MKVARPDWAGKAVVCMASGPSLTAEDAELVRQSGHPVVVTNTTFRMAPWADVVFGMDLKWWQHYHEEVKKTCTGRRMSTSAAARSIDVESLYNTPWYPAASFQNSGSAIVGLAVAAGAAKAIMLGFDCQFTGGKTHWHGDHPRTMGNAASLKRWPRMFDNLLKNTRNSGCRIVNASRATSLTLFERAELEAEL